MYPYILVVIGVCMKNFMKLGDYGEVYSYTNWAFAIGLFSQYLTVNFFFYIHDKSRGKATNWKPFKNRDTTLAFMKKGGCKLLSMTIFLLIASFDLRPYPTLVKLIIRIHNIYNIYIYNLFLLLKTKMINFKEKGKKSFCFIIFIALSLTFPHLFLQCQHI